MNQQPDKNYVLVVSILGSLLVAFTTSSLNVALPSIGHELSMDAISLSWVTTGYLLASVVFMVPFGRIADIYGRKKVYSWGAVVFLITSCLLLLTNSEEMLLTLRVIQGIGGAMTFSTSVAILTSAFPTGNRGRVLGLVTASVYIGFTIGPFLGGILTELFGWRSIFFVTSLVGLIIVVLVFWKLKGDWIEAGEQKIDIVGSILYSLTIVALVYGFTHLPDIVGFVLVIIAAAGFVAFIMLESKVKSPVIDINLFRKNKTFAFSGIAALVNYGAAWSVVFLISLYLQYIKGLSPTTAGLVMVSQPVVQALFSPLAGRLSDRIEGRLVASAGMAITFLGLVVLVFLSRETSLLQVIIGMIFLGFGYALFTSPNTNVAMNAVSKRFYGIASATMATMRQIGMIISMGIVMLILNVYVGRVQIIPENYDAFLISTRVSFIFSSVLCFLGIFASMARGPAVADDS